MRKSKKKHELSNDEVSLNVMPFIDIFSLLCTFLLFSAVFVSIGILEVQVPFLTNAAPPDKKDDKNKRTLSINVNLERKSIELETSYDRAPVNRKKFRYDNNQNGRKKFHRKLIDIKMDNLKADKVTLYVDDNIIYKDLVSILDQIKLRFPGDKGFDAKSRKEAQTGIQSFLFNKVIMGSVIL